MNYELETSEADTNHLLQGSTRRVHFRAECKAKQACGWPTIAGCPMRQALAIELQICIFPFFFSFLETGFYYVALAGLELRYMLASAP